MAVIARALTRSNLQELKNFIFKQTLEIASDGQEPILAMTENYNQQIRYQTS